jgi:hypothetical protein
LVMCLYCIPGFDRIHDDDEEEKTNKRTSADSTRATTVSGGSVDLVDLDFSDIEDGQYVHSENGSSNDGDEDLEKSLTIMNLADLYVEEKEEPVHSCCAAGSSNLTGKTFIEETSATSLASTATRSWDSLKWSDLVNIEKERESACSAYKRGYIDNTSSHTSSSTDATSGWSNLEWSQLIAVAERTLSQISLADHSDDRSSSATINEDIETAQDDDGSRSRRR